jgi:hypothetical protein
MHPPAQPRLKPSVLGYEIVASLNADSPCFSITRHPGRGRSAHRAEAATEQGLADRMRGGRWKIFKGQNDGWMEEYRLYHRDGDGRVVDENDDAISASLAALRNLSFISQSNIRNWALCDAGIV